MAENRKANNMSEYKGYDSDVGRKATLKYIREKTKQVTLRWKQTEYDERIAPAIEKSGIPMTTFIKQAVDEKIARMG